MVQRSGGSGKSTAKDSRSDNNVTIAQNREAYHNYSVEDRLEAGVVLTGSEIKSLREGRASLREGFVRVARGEAWLEGVHIPPYEHSSYMNHEPTRPRKLLLHKDEIIELSRRSQALGYTVVPLQMYLKNGRAKVEIGIAKGKRQYDKRQAIAERDSKREIARELRDRG